MWIPAGDGAQALRRNLHSTDLGSTPQIRPFHVSNSSALQNADNFLGNLQHAQVLVMSGKISLTDQSLILGGPDQDIGGIIDE